MIRKHLPNTRWLAPVALEFEALVGGRRFSEARFLAGRYSDLQIGRDRREPKAYLPQGGVEGRSRPLEAELYERACEAVTADWSFRSNNKRASIGQRASKGEGRRPAWE